MDPDLILIFSFVLVIVLVVLTFGSIAGKRDRMHKLQRLELEARIAEAKAGTAAKEAGDYRKLEERVRVLERIATDGDHALAAQIEELRALDATENVRTPEAAR
ncbi:hypothetical protein K3172_05110 [Qipengyuania sp. 6B39]|uniref:hypothetical protein n=1 Tax=Qipengyuania proteolytica TaxID=2867239 RepID=UPI001C895FE4|nr:hypothetical protein [Qipengyuania proteolytica]MBX7495230.1 hypothetical protein [Qipengyuania proteolytica]